MTRSIFLLGMIFMVICQSSKAQNYIEDRAGRPIKSSLSVEVSGDPMMFSQWVRGTVELAGNKSYKDVQLNMNLIDQEVVFKGKNGETLAFTDDVVSALFIDEAAGRNRVIRKGFPPANGVTAKDFLEVLADGTLTLLKKNSKVVWQEKVYNSATTKQTILERSVYYTFDKLNNRMSVLKPTRSAILSQLAKHKDQVSAYIQSEKIDFAKDADLIKLFVYYNSLP